MLHFDDDELEAGADAGLAAALARPGSECYSCCFLIVPRVHSIESPHDPPPRPDSMGRPGSASHNCFNSPRVRN